VQATPERNSDGPRLASEVLAAIGPETRRFERDDAERRTSSTRGDASYTIDG
jgi:hypothetical protein